ncbi:DUF7344 domain-containing protein [Halorarum salinum]|uniref:DUF7344 domain-containing protein n=1 Tax=Halorarum salinum TaxID=2743089 RepID=A0A7D5LCD6_9EURY|nr:hypothetical protein [Halobaculum salinum]QLG63107.1 hypothetical protein HUG12_15760 [Halobaculum salinum]
MAQHLEGNGETDDGLDDASVDDVFDCLASADRRDLLARLRESAPAALPRKELATTPAAGDVTDASGDVTDGERRRALATLHHQHLPKLEDAGLITRNADGDAVALADHPAFEDESVLDAVDGDAAADGESLDALFRAIADGRRRTVLDALSHQYQPIRTETLARDVASREAGSAAREVSTADLEGVLRSLRHVHLPHLRDAGMVEYDADEGTVSYEGHPALRVPWMHSALGTDFRAGLTDTPADADVWNLEGRERVVSCGQSLCEEADEELFLMFTTTGLLEAGCFSRIRQAVDRGVDVYLGTADPTVREFVAEHAPEISLWEPRMNWLDLPVEGENVGRLVFADREAVMVGTLGGESDDGVREERAVLGEGADNTLVVLLGQMLHSRFERFEDVEGKLRL